MNLRPHLMLLGAVFLLAGCGNRSQIVDDLTAIPSTLMEATATPVAESTENPERTPTSIDNLLSGDQSYVVIASVHANLLAVGTWLGEDMTAYEQAAIISPLTQIYLDPLADIFNAYLPQADLAAQWREAELIYAGFYQSLQSWLAGDMDQSTFTDTHAGYLTRSTANIEQANQIAAQAFGLVPEGYGENYATAMDEALEIGRGVGSSDPSAASTDNDTQSLENPGLVVGDLNPFVYQFAGAQFFEVIGLLQNTGQTPQERVEIRIQFFDDEHYYLGTTLGTLPIQVAEPGQIYPFSTSLIEDGYEKDLLRWAAYEITVTSRPLEQITAIYYQDFELISTSITQGTMGEYLIEGSLTNIGDQTVGAGNIVVAVMAYDEAGRFVGTGLGIAEVAEILEPGMSIPFSAAVQPASAEPVHYEFVAEAVLSH